MSNDLPPSFVISGRRVGPGEPVFIIAEVGINHGGDPAACARMIEAAVEAGADAVKLQIVEAAESYAEGTDSYTEFRGTELDDEALIDLMRLAERLQCVLFATPGDSPSLRRIVRLGMPAVKISSSLLTNLSLIAEAARQQLPLIMSTGLAHESEIAAAVDVARMHGASGVALLKCTALYPAPDASVNLAGLSTLARRFGVPVGYSDHTLDDLACTAAVACGAMLIEKHFTLDRTSPRADHHISMEPVEFSRMTRQIRRLETMRGDGELVPSPAEEALRSERHRYLVARCDIASGELFSADNVGLKRPIPGHAGLPATEFESILGRTAIMAIAKDQAITAGHVSDQTSVPGSRVRERGGV